MESMKNQPIEPRKYEYVYSSIVVLICLHLSGFYGMYLAFTSAKWATIFLAIILHVASEIGVTAGAHRLWSHRSYKAKLPLQIILSVFYSLCYQFSATDWVRNHRLHHKHSDTDADPHNASRGLFFSHFGWMLVRKHPEVKIKGKLTDLSDIYANPVLQFQKKHAFLIFGMMSFVLPTIIPMYLWKESLNNAWHITMLRYISTVNITCSINSIAHKYGYKPYDKSIRPAQSLFVSMITYGEGFHNYHHSFPWDYRAAELGNNWMNLTTNFIDFFAWIGWAYDLKTTNVKMIKSRAEKSGDGSGIWGWGDKDQTKENIDAAVLVHKESVN